MDTDETRIEEEFVFHPCRFVFIRGSKTTSGTSSEFSVISVSLWLKPHLGGLSVHGLSIAGFGWKENIRAEFSSEFVEQFRLHECVVVGDLEGDDAFVFEGVGEFAAEAIQVGFLHDEDDVGPADVAGGDDDAGVGLRAGGADLIGGKALEEFFGGEAAHPVPAADEEELLGMGGGHC